MQDQHHEFADLLCRPQKKNMVKDLDVRELLETSEMQEGSSTYGGEISATNNIMSSTDVDIDCSEMIRNVFMRTSNWRNQYKLLEARNKELESLNKALQHTMKQNLAFQAQQQQHLLEQINELRTKNQHLQNEATYNLELVRESETQIQMLRDQNLELLEFKRNHSQHL